MKHLGLVKLEKFTKCPAGQIVKYKLNDNKKKTSAQSLNPTYCRRLKRDIFGKMLEEGR